MKQFEIFKAIDQMEALTKANEPYPADPGNN